MSGWGEPLFIGSRMGSKDVEAWVPVEVLPESKWSPQGYAPGRRHVPERLDLCIGRARDWADRIPVEISKVNRLIRRFNVFGAALSAVAGAFSISQITRSPEVWWQIVSAVAAISGAISIAVPSTLGLRERGEQLVVLAGEYSRLLGRLLDARTTILLGAEPESLNSLYSEYDNLKTRREPLGIAREK
ncbi:hypothetical protein RKE29_02780 [Streptomyces sp. B1866]|uniref:hypothetical protein n=1 Tax=Streptomyces sp. B1866 TaxID=3075431 RepID=UPI00288F440E|nr:hypothetical protein [Streptomyces sp. B1866]MDT3395584.1 hypothetical protein [Streptomyces sp. B1866]